MKTIALARHGMLECGTNFKDTMTETCHECNSTDDENHRLNNCVVLNHLNRADNPLKCTFENVFSEDKYTLDQIIAEIEKVWEVQYANGRIKRM